MPKIFPIVEGDGDTEAVPILLRRVLHEHLEQYHWNVTHPIRAHSLAVLRKRLGDYIAYADIKEDVQAVLILLDLDDGCPAIEAKQLADSIRALSARLPVAVVLSHREYEAWFLASIETIARGGGPKYSFSPEFLRDPTPPSAVEKIRDAKGWISKQMVSGHRYKETLHQPSMTTLIDLKLAAGRSRSMRRLLHAIELLVQHASEGHFVSP